jgi:anaerobic dimethyl sulfoxide reductase subunit B (iron-sulfur subunit)
VPDEGFGLWKMNDLIEKYGDVKNLEGLPDSSITKPAIIFRAHEERRKVLAYPVQKALELLAERGELPRIYSSGTDVTDVEGFVQTNELHLKTETAEEALYFTRADES